MRQFIVFEEGIGFRIEDYFASYPNGDVIIIELKPTLNRQQRMLRIRNSPANLKILMNLNEYRKESKCNT